MEEARPVAEKLLEVRGLKTYFYTDDGVVPAVDGVDFSLGKGETLGIVGESGCGKSVTSLSIMRLIPDPPGKIVDGEILFDGSNLLEKSEAEMRSIRGNDISMIFQEPMTSLNPVFTIGDQIMEAIILHQRLSKAEARERAIEMLRLVGIPVPERRIDEYPHQLSGGMRQRVMIAMALSCNPKLLIADEPTTALDVTIQAQILDLMRKLRDEFRHCDYADHPRLGCRCRTGRKSSSDVCRKDCGGGRRSAAVRGAPCIHIQLACWARFPN
jgi:ABC-type dipeptide/oligopeptide/nickel transport system ATPase component